MRLGWTATRFHERRSRVSLSLFFFLVAAQVLCAFETLHLDRFSLLAEKDGSVKGCLVKIMSIYRYNVCLVII